MEPISKKLGDFLADPKFFESLNQILEKEGLAEFSKVFEKTKDLPSPKRMEALAKTNEAKLAKIIGQLFRGEIDLKDLALSLKKELKISLAKAQSVSEKINPLLEPIKKELFLIKEEKKVPAKKIEEKPPLPKKPDIYREPIE